MTITVIVLTLGIYLFTILSTLTFQNEILNASFRNNNRFYLQFSMYYIIWKIRNLAIILHTKFILKEIILLSLLISNFDLSINIRNSSV